MLLPLLLSLAMVPAPGQRSLASPVQSFPAAAAHPSLAGPTQDSLPALHSLRDEDITTVTSRYEDQTLTVTMKNGAVYLYHHVDWDLEDTNPATPERIRAATKDLGHIIFTKAEHMPEFPGGEEAWQKYIKAFCTTHKDDIGDAGSAVVAVQFTVHLKGQITDIHLAVGATPVSSQQKALAIQAIRESPSWTPATQNGHLVVCYKVVKIPLE